MTPVRSATRGGQPPRREVHTMHEAPTAVERTPRVPLWAIVLPAVTLLAGMAIGAAVTGAGKAPTPAASSSATPSSTASPSTVQVRVPVECLQLAQEATTALPPIDEAKSAVQSLDVQRLQDYIAKMQVAGPHLQELGQQCRDNAGKVQLAPVPEPS